MADRTTPSTPSPAPTAHPAIRPTVRVGNLVFASGQVAWRDGGLVAAGRVGAEVDVATARECAAQAARNLLEVVGTDVIARVAKLTVFIAGAPGFAEHAAVAFGASEAVHQALGERGAHARTTIGVASLPLGSPIEVEGIFEVVDAGAPKTG